MSTFPFVSRDIYSVTTAISTLLLVFDLGNYYIEGI
jgi:hypothetical protein